LSLNFSDLGESMKLRLGSIALAFVSLVLSMTAQTTSSKTVATNVATQSAATNAVVASQVPRLVKFSGTVLAASADAAGSGIVAREAEAPASVVGITFSLYSEQTGGVPLWSEVQNVQVDKTGHYTVELGSTQPDGLPVELFSSAQAQWLGVQQQGQAEQPRIMLLSVPYALKAADAETFGGKPPSAFMPAPDSGTAANGSGILPIGKKNNTPSVSGGGTANYIALWTGASDLGSSLIYQAANNYIGIGTTTPEYPMVVHAHSSGPVVEVTQSSSRGMAVLATAYATLGDTTGVQGEVASPSGTGILGLATSATGDATGVNGSTASSTGTGVAGSATANTGANLGVYGTTVSPSGVGIIGDNKANSGAAVGMKGLTASQGGIAMLGVGVAQSTEGATVTLRPIGVWGDTNVDTGIGVLATADFGIAFAGYNNAENISTVKFENDETTDFNGNILATHNPHFDGTCVIDVGGNLGCTGSKSAVVPVDGGTRKVALYAVEAPENWFEDAGSGRLSNGAAVVQLESTFAQTVNGEVEYHVFLTPNGDCKGLYVTNKTGDSFEVRELGGGTANVGFDYRIMARRKGYETIRLADKTKQFDRVANEGRPVPGKVVVSPKVPNPPGFITRAAAVPSQK
jgi:hypothetical protein